MAIKSTDLHMNGTSGVYQTNYADQEITVRIFESPELIKDQRSHSAWQAVITYKSNDGTYRQDLDTIEPDMLDHCRDNAIEQMKKKGLDVWGEQHKAYIAENYWSLIK